MHDEHGELGGHRHVLDGERATVEEHGVIGAAVHRRHLVLDAAGNTGGDVLGPLRGECELGSPEAEAGAIAERERARDLERRARRQPRADRHGRRDRQVDAERLPAEIGEHAHHSRNRASPHGSGRGRVVGAVGGDVDLRRRSRTNAATTRPSSRAVARTSTSRSMARETTQPSW